MNEFEEQQEVDRIQKAAAATAGILGIKNTLAFQLLMVFMRLTIIFEKKQADYGKGNIADFGELGVLVRLNDKIHRLKNLLQGGKAPQNETLDDTWLDACNYAAIGYMVRQGWWK